MWLGEPVLCCVTSALGNLTMQTFLPYSDFNRSALALDRQRLGKQRVECKQIVLALGNQTYGWQNHPAVRMWRGHARVLCEYGFIICTEWVKRGYVDSLKDFFEYEDNLMYLRGVPRVEPLWLGQAEFHRSHQSNLIRKNPSHYQHQFPGVAADLPYIWPLERCVSVIDPHLPTNASVVPMYSGVAWASKIRDQQANGD